MLQSCFYYLLLSCLYRAFAFQHNFLNCLNFAKNCLIYMSQRTWRIQANHFVEPHHYYLPFMVLTYAMSFVKVVKQSLVISHKIQTFNVGRCVPCCYCGTNTMGVTKYFLILLKAYSRRLNSCLVLLPGSRTRAHKA